jgi:diketogulonate reductase-like aldo/keto reductase
MRDMSATRKERSIEIGNEKKDSNAYRGAKSRECIRYKELGNTGVRIPEVGLGTWNYRGGIEPIRKAIALGACLIDTAESYGTEELVGEAIRGFRERVFLATKALPRNFKYADLLQAADRSLLRLGVDHIDLYQLHWPNYTVPIEETMGAMEKLVDMGKIRFIGVSNFSAAEIRKAQAALSRSSVVANQVRYSLVDRTIENGLLRDCQENQITIIAFSPLARGIHNIRKRDPKNVLGRIAELTGKTEAQVALNWCVEHESVVAITTASSAEHVMQVCGASGWRLSRDHVRVLEEGIGFRRRGRSEAALRRVARGALQRFGYHQ